MQFEGRVLPRALDSWRLPNGRRFTFPFHEAADTLDLETEVFIDASIKALLARATPSNLAEYQNLLENWRQTLPHTYAWARPDRLWFALPFTNADHVREASLRLNDQRVPLEWFAPKDRPHGSRIIAYTDLTDFVDFGSVNRLALQLRGLGPNQFLGPFLDYPPDVPVTAWAPALEAEGESQGVIYTRPIDPDLPVRVTSAAASSPRVLAVEVTPPFLVASAKHTFCAEIDLPPDRLANVWISVTAAEDIAMTWEEGRKKWIFEWTVPERTMNILDVDRALVWAVAREGVTSSAFSIPLRWLFAAPSREKIEQALESPWDNVREETRVLLAAVSGAEKPPTR